MNIDRQRLEVEQNYDAFQRILTTILAEHRDEYALMRDGCIVEFFASPGAANIAGAERFPDGYYSIQEVTDEPIDLGFFSHVAI